MPVILPTTNARSWERAVKFDGMPLGGTSSKTPAEAFYNHSSGKRVSTDCVVLEAIRNEYPHHYISTVPQFSADLLQFAAAGFASADIFEDDEEKVLKWHMYLPPFRRLDSEMGGLGDQIMFGKYVYTWKTFEFILYFVDGRDGTMNWPEVILQYLVGDSSEIDQLVLAAGKYTSILHDEIWVFDQGFWQKDREMWNSIQKSSWENVILDEDMKKGIRGDTQRFFSSRDQYEKLGVPWKRGIIFHGPPGNGKTISIKATMHMLYERKDQVPTLYVKTLASFAPPEFSLGEIFRKARQEAPCYLVFEDLDSVVSDEVRSFFLNEVDGLSGNDGILMVGSTNHLEQLDPGISKRPSRFDRKYFFPNPDFDQRVQYCKFWQGKLKNNDEVKFPNSLCDAVAKITDGFSFAYIQEAFVAALLVLAYGKDGEEVGAKVRDSGDDWEFVESAEQKLAKMADLSVDSHKNDKSGDPGDPLKDNILWIEIKKQIALLRKELNEGVE